MALSGSYKPGVSNGLSASTLGHSTLGSNSVAKRHHSLAKLHQVGGALALLWCGSISVCERFPGAAAAMLASVGVLMLLAGGSNAV
eukprot:355819-Chlamydomonas_euryale.AAC.5